MSVFAGMVESAAISDVTRGIFGSSNRAVGVRASLIESGQPMTGKTASMGNNLCNGAPC